MCFSGPQPFARLLTYWSVIWYILWRCWVWECKSCFVDSPFQNRVEICIKTKVKIQRVSESHINKITYKSRQDRQVVLCYVLQLLSRKYVYMSHIQTSHRQSVMGESGLGHRGLISHHLNSWLVMPELLNCLELFKWKWGFRVCSVGDVKTLSIKGLCQNVCGLRAFPFEIFVRPISIKSNMEHFFMNCSFFVWI